MGKQFFLRLWLFIAWKRLLFEFGPLLSGPEMTALGDFLGKWGTSSCSLCESPPCEVSFFSFTGGMLVGEQSHNETPALVSVLGQSANRVGLSQHTGCSFCTWKADLFWSSHFFCSSPHPHYSHPSPHHALLDHSNHSPTCFSTFNLVSCKLLLSTQKLK